LRDVLNERIRNEHPDRSHLISIASTYEYTDVFGECFETGPVAEVGNALDGLEEGGQVAEAEETVVGGQPATAFCICPVECEGLACNDCSKLNTYYLKEHLCFYLYMYACFNKIF